MPESPDPDPLFLLELKPGPDAAQRRRGLPDRDFPVGPNDALFDRVPVLHLFGTDYTADQTAYLEKHAMCPVCGERPETVEPLPEGWTWDCLAFTIWCWCPTCDPSPKDGYA